MIEKVGQQAAEYGLMSNNEHILLTLELHNDRFQSRNQVFVGLPYSDNGVKSDAMKKRADSPLG